MLAAVGEFFNSEYFMPHGHCFLWQPEILWLHVISDSLIAAAYFSIPFVLIYFVRHRKDFPFKSVLVLFGAFILLCGTTHLINIWVLWNPNYAFSGLVKMLTAITSVLTFCVAVKIIPQALQLVSPQQLMRVNEQLNDEIIEREKAQKMLEDAYIMIDAEVQERTAELERVKKKLASSVKDTTEMEMQLREYIRSLKDIQSAAEEVGDETAKLSRNEKALKKDRKTDKKL